MDLVTLILAKNYINKKLEETEDRITPVKGVDYFTEADKNEIVQQVLTEIPAAEGVEF